jgi:hypothetical protein
MVYLSPRLIYDFGFTAQAKTDDYRICQTIFDFVTEVSMNRKLCAKIESCLTNSIVGRFWARHMHTHACTCMDREVYPCRHMQALCLDMHRHVRRSIHMDGDACTCMYMHIYAYLCMCMHVYACLCISMHIYAWVCIHMHMHARRDMTNMIPQLRWEEVQSLQENALLDNAPLTRFQFVCYEEVYELNGERE